MHVNSSIASEHSETAGGVRTGASLTWDLVERRPRIVTLQWPLVVPSLMTPQCEP